MPKLFGNRNYVKTIAIIYFSLEHGEPPSQFYSLGINAKSVFVYLHYTAESQNVKAHSFSAFLRRVDRKAMQQSRFRKNHSRSVKITPIKGLPTAVAAALVFPLHRAPAPWADREPSQTGNVAITADSIWSFTVLVEKFQYIQEPPRTGKTRCTGGLFSVHPMQSAENYIGL